jgi:hypothetical protein
MLKEVPETSVVSSVLRANVAVDTTSYQKTDLYVSLAANSAYYVDMALVTADDPFRYKLVYSGSLSTNGGKMFQQQMLADLYSECSVDNEYPASQADEQLEVRGLVQTASAGVLMLQVRVEPKEGSVGLSAGSYLIARSLPGIGGETTEAGERLVLEDGTSIVLLENAFSLLKET